MERNDYLEIPTDLIDLVTMQEDGSLRVDMQRARGNEKIHFSPTYYVYEPGDPVHAKLLELTDIKKPGDCYAFGFKKKESRAGLEEDS